MSIIKVNYEAVMAIIGQMDMTRNALDNLNHEFMTSSGSMVAAMEGEERNAFEVTKANTEREFQKLSDAIHATRNAAHNYVVKTQATDSANARNWPV